MYTNVIRYGNKMLVRGYNHGRAFLRKDDFKPTLFVDGKKYSNIESKYKTLSGKTVYPISPGSMRDCKDFMEQYENVEGFGIYGLTQYEYQYISEEYPNEIEFDPKLIKIVTIDIETATENGFPNVKTANEEILLISIMDNTTKNRITFGCGEFESTDDKVKYIKCNDEMHLIKRFLTFWQNNIPDVITGWNIKFFDIPYIVRRIRSLGLEPEVMSPWKMIHDETAFNNDNKEEIFSIPGIAILDYLELYKKFTFTPRESYRLDHIAEVELGQHKLDHSEYGSFKEFYNDNWPKFVAYNLHDVLLVDRLEDRLKLINLAFTLAYKAKVNYEDVYSPVRTWDILIYNYLRNKNIVIPLKSSAKKVPFEGGYVKDPIVGMHKWVASFDLTSLYPHIIMGWNMSPETITEQRIPVQIDDLINKTVEIDQIHDMGLSMVANGWCYKKDVRGFMPDLMQQLYVDRSKAKKEMLQLESEYERTKDPELENRIAMLDTLQLAIKVTLNSGYGAITNAYFRYFDIRIGEGITLTGQLASQWIARKLNEFLNKAMKTEDHDYVLYSDTDSVYVCLEKIVETYAKDKDTNNRIKFMNKFCQEVLQPYIDKSYQELADYTNAYEQQMKMKLEVLADVGIFYKKKKYLLNVHSSEGVVYAEPKLKIKGLSMVQSSTPEVVRSSLRDTIKIAISGSETDIRNFRKHFEDTFNSYSSEQIAFPRSVNGLDVYKSSSTIYAKGTPIAVRAALLYNHHLKRLKLDKKYPLISNSDKIKFVYVKMPNPFHENIIAFPQYLPKEFGLHEYIDYSKQFEKAFLDPLEDLVEPMGWQLNEVSSIEDFFV